MGRARDLAATAAGGTLIPRIDALEANDIVLANDIDAVEAAAAAASTAAGNAQTTANALAALPADWTNVVENYANVPIGQASQSFWRAINHVDLTNVKAGQKYLVVGQGQVRSEWNFNVECAPLLTWTPSLGALAHDLTGHNLCLLSIVGRNVMQTREHYFDWVRVGFFKPTSDYANVRIYNNVRHRSSDPNIDGSGNQVMVVGPGQTGIFVLRHK